MKILVLIMVLLAVAYAVRRARTTPLDGQWHKKVAIWWIPIADPPKRGWRPGYSLVAVPLSSYEEMRVRKSGYTELYRRPLSSAGAQNSPYYRRENDSTYLPWWKIWKRAE